MRPPKKYFIISGTYNAEEYVSKCIDSVESQIQDGFEIKHILIDDGSTDNTYSIMQEWSSEPQMLIRHSQNLGPIQSQLDGFCMARQLGDDYDVIVQLDGDDWLLTPSAIQTVHDTYVRKECGATYGDYINTTGIPSCCRVPDWSNLRQDIKRNGWPFSHLRTFRVGFTSHLSEDALRDDDGEFYPAAPDVAICLPIFEMVGQDDVQFIRQPLVAYNGSNPLHEARLRYFDQVRCANACYNRPAHLRVVLGDKQE